MNCSECPTALDGGVGFMNGKSLCLHCYHAKRQANRAFQSVLVQAGEIVPGIAHPRKIAIGDYVFKENGQRVAVAFPKAEAIIRYNSQPRERITLAAYSKLPADKFADIRDVCIIQVDE